MWQRALLAIAVASAVSGILVPEIKRCDRKLPKEEFEKCLVDACQGAIVLIKNPIPDLPGFPVMEPFELPSMSIGEGGVVAVQQNYKNAKISGLSNLKVEKVFFDFDKMQLNLAGTFPKIKMVSDYSLNGKILLLPVQGEGTSTLDIDNVKATMNMGFEEVKKKNGKIHLKMTTNKLVFDPEHVSYNFENLFNGDKQLGDNINKVLNENWKEVFEDVRKGYEEAFGTIVQSLSNIVFNRIPKNELFVNESE